MKLQKQFIECAITLAVVSGSILAAQVQTIVPEVVSGAKPVTAEHITAAVDKAAGGVSAFTSDEPPPDLRAAKDELERRSIEAALNSSAGNKTQAAKLLNMPLRTFMWKVKRFGKREGD